MYHYSGNRDVRLIVVVFGAAYLALDLLNVLVSSFTCPEVHGHCPGDVARLLSRGCGAAWGQVRPEAKKLRLPKHEVNIP